MKSNLNIFINIFYIFIFFAGITSSFGQTRKYIFESLPATNKMSGYVKITTAFNVEVGNYTLDPCSGGRISIQLKDSDFPLVITYNILHKTTNGNLSACTDQNSSSFFRVSLSELNETFIEYDNCGNYHSVETFPITISLYNNLGQCSLLSSINFFNNSLFSSIYYSTNGTDNWLPFPSNYSNLTIQDLPGFANYTGNLYVKAKYTKQVYDKCSKSITYYYLDSDIIIYSIKPCPPTLLNTSSPNYTICNDQNGEVTFTFSRPLDTDNGEKFLFNYNVIDGPTSSVNSNSTNVEMISRTVYKLKNIAADSYEFTFQTQFNNNTPSTVAPISNFTITKTLPLKFQATPIHPLCSDGMAGITIMATGGTPPYFYILDGGTPVEFTTPSEKIEVSIADHTIKVIDKNLCTEK